MDTLTSRLDTARISEAHEAYVSVLQQYVAGLIEEVEPAKWGRVEVAFPASERDASLVKSCRGGPPYFNMLYLPGIHFDKSDGFDRDYVLTNGHSIEGRKTSVAAGLYVVEIGYFEPPYVRSRWNGSDQRAIDWSSAKSHYPLHPGFYERLQCRLSWVSKPRQYTPRVNA